MLTVGMSGGMADWARNGHHRTADSTHQHFAAQLTG